MKRQAHDSFAGPWIGDLNRISQQSVFTGSLAALGALLTIIFASGIALNIAWFDDKFFMAVALPMVCIGLFFTASRTALDPWSTGQFGYLDPIPPKNLAPDAPNTPKPYLSPDDPRHDGFQQELNHHRRVQRIFGGIQWGSYATIALTLGLFFAFGVS